MVIMRRGVFSAVVNPAVVVARGLANITQLHLPHELATKNVQRWSCDAVHVESVREKHYTTDRSQTATVDLSRDSRGI